MALSDVEQEQVDQLRPLVGAWDGDDQSLHDLLVGAGGDLNLAAAAGWRVKASALADLGDVQEGSSKRSLSQLAPAAWAMVGRYEAAAASASGTSADGSTRWRAIVR